MENNFWNVFKPGPIANKIANALGISNLLATCLIARGIKRIEEAEKYLEPSLNHLYDPSLFQDMEKACKRIKEAVEKGEKILIHGDYDVDGITSTAILLKFFKILGAKAQWYIPHRITEGYSISNKAIEKIKREKIGLCITVDNGISALDEIEEIKRAGCDVIVTDHHEPSAELPSAYALINPKIHGCSYPFRELSGAGVAFKLVWGLSRIFSGTKKVSQRFREFLLKAIGLVALGTIADVCPLLDENRVFIVYGLDILSASNEVWIKALLKLTGLEGRRLTVKDVAFRLAPRLNAAGRISSAELSLFLLSTTDPTHAKELSRVLDKANEQRQKIEQKILKDAKKMILDDPSILKKNIIILGKKEWHPGVVGIVASRLCEEYEKPVILLALDGERSRGSARSIEGIPIHEILKKTKEHLIAYGGHALAGGVLMDEKKLDQFKTAAERIAMDILPPQKKVIIDAELKLKDINYALTLELQKLKPFGPSNPPPLFGTKKVEVVGYPYSGGYLGSDMKFLVRQGDTVKKVVIKNYARKAIPNIERGNVLSIVYTPVLGFNSTEIELEAKNIWWIEKNAYAAF